LGRFSVRVFGSYEEQNDLARLDRSWLRSDDRRFIGGTDGRSVIPVGGRILNAANTNTTSPTIPLPGTNALFLRIPANSDGRNVTVADYVNAGTPTDADRYDSAPYTNATNRFRRSALSADLEHAWRPWLKATLSLGWRQNNSFGKSGPVSLSTTTNTVNPAASTTIPAGYPGNPFGVPITLQKFFWDIGVLDRRYGMETWSLNAGLSGVLPREWRYDAGVSYARSDPTTKDQVFQFDSLKLGAAIRSATPPVLLHDSLRRVGNPAGTIESFFLTGSNSELPRTWTYDFKVDGPVFTLPGGKIVTAAGTELREEYVSFDRQFFAATTESAQPAGKRVVTAGFLETQVPIIAPGKNSLPLIHQFTLNAAGRRDSYNDFGGSTRLRFGANYRPVKWLMLRATHGEAFKVPLLIDLNRPIGRQAQTFTPTGTFSLVDTFRNNEPVLGPVINQTGGNPNLRPEQSTNENLGVVLESPFALFKGFSFSVSRNTIRIEDRVGGLTYQERLAFFPEMFVRGPSLGDGLPGKIIEVDNRSVNVALFKNEAWDYQLRYSRVTANWGTIDLLANATETTKLEVRARPGVPPSATQSALLRPARGSANLNWNHRGLSVGVSAIYQEGFPQSTVTSTLMPSTILWNGQLGYDFERGTLAGRVPFFGRYLAGTRISLGFVNIFNEEPWISATGATSSVIDPRLRRYSITVRKSFGGKPGVRLPGR
jgi:iron complex outermembrane receptor protein